MNIRSCRTTLDACCDAAPARRHRDVSVAGTEPLSTDRSIDASQGTSRPNHQGPADVSVPIPGGALLVAHHPASDFAEWSRRIEDLACALTTVPSGIQARRNDFASHMGAYVRHNGLCVSRMRHKPLCVSLWGESETQPWGRRTRRRDAPCGVSRDVPGRQGYRSSGPSSWVLDRRRSQGTCRWRCVASATVPQHRNEVRQMLQRHGGSDALAQPFRCSEVGRLVVRNPALDFAEWSRRIEDLACVLTTVPSGIQARRDGFCVSYGGVCETQRILRLTHETQTDLRLT